MQKSGSASQIFHSNIRNKVKQLKGLIHETPNVILAHKYRAPVA